MATTYYSFDVFDTCLCRLCGGPRQVFDVLSLKVIAMMGYTLPEGETMRQLFVATRCEIGGDDLVGIYREMQKVFPLPCSAEEMSQMEMKCEASLLRPIEATRKLVESKRRMTSLKGGG